MGVQGRLTVEKIEAAKPAPGKKLATLFDGGGLRMEVRIGDGGRPLRSWIYRYRVPDGEMVVSKKTGIVYNRERNMGLGPYPDISLAKARKRALEARLLVLDGIDPLEQKHERRRVRRDGRRAVTTFDDATAAYLRQFESNWRSPVHRRQWEQSLRDHASPVIGHLDVHRIIPDDVLRCIGPIWPQIPKTAERVRSRIERVLSYAGRHADNPAAWKGYD